MTNVLANIARMSSTTTGDGTLTLGVAVSASLTFAGAGITDGQEISYAIEDYDVAGDVIAREVGRGTYGSAGPTLARSAVYASTNGGSAINCSGRQHVFITALKEDFDTFLTSVAAAAAYQPLDAELTTWASLTPSANAQSLVTAVNFAAMRALLDLEAGTDFLSPAAIAAAYQPLDGNLTGIAALTTTSYGRALLELANAAALAALVDPFFLTPTEGNAAYQPLDADLTTLAANITAFGHSLVDDADAGAARATLGLVIGTNVQAYSAVLANTTASFLTAQETKLGFISVTQAVDLDAIETRVNALDAAVVLSGTWDASAGTFPGGGTAQAGQSYIVSVSGTVDGVAFVANDRIVAILDNASISTYAANWHKLDYTDAVLSVDGATGAVSLSGTYQPLDSELTTLAANITAFGHSLVDDADAATARATLGLGTMAVETASDYLTTAAAASGYQPLDSDLTTWAGLTPSANAQSLVTAADYAAMRALLDLEAGTDFLSPSAISAAYQPLDGELTALAGLTSAADKGIQFTGSGTAATYDLTTAGKALLDDADASAQRTTLGLGTIATQAANNVSISGGSVTGITDLAVADGGTGSSTASGARTNLGLVIGTDVQAYDAELAAIAGLTSAADKVPYFTGSGTAAVADLTSAGRALIDDASASAQRTTLGLGTAATQNTGTSGATLPFLNGANTFSAQQIIDISPSTAASLVAQLSDDGAAAGPAILVRRISASPAANDNIGFFNFQGRDTAGVNTIYAQLISVIVDPTDGSEDGALNVYTSVAGTVSGTMILAAGMRLGTPTGGDKGVGTLNATAVYDDSALLCAPVEFIKSGTVNTSTWDAFAIDSVHPGGFREHEETIETDEDVVHIEPDADGSFKQVKTKRRVPVMDLVPVFDDKGNGIDAVEVPRVRRTVVPEKKVSRQNELAHEFKAMLDEGFDPRDPKAYFDKMLKDEALPGLKTKANWVPNGETNAKRTNRVVLALELQSAVVKTLYERLDALEKVVADAGKVKK